MMNDIFRERGSLTSASAKQKFTASDIVLYIDVLNQRRKILIREIDEIDSQLRKIIEALEIAI